MLRFGLIPNLPGETKCRLLFLKNTNRKLLQIVPRIAYFESSNSWPKNLKPLTKNPIEEFFLLKQETAISSRMRFVYQHQHHQHCNYKTSDNCTAVGDFTRFFLGIEHWSRYRLRSSWRTWKREETGEKLMQPELAWNLSNIQIYKNLDFWPFSSLDFRFGAAGAGGGEAEIENMFEYCTIALCSPIEQLEVRNIFNCFVFGHFWSTHEWMA